jgi:Uma2 family endonuclease
MNDKVEQLPQTEQRPDFGEPAWDVAQLFPNQGTWSEEEYLSLNGNRLVEFSHGYVEVLAMPTELHQAILQYLAFALIAFARANNAGKAFVAPLRIRLWEGKYREPDIVFMRTENSSRRHNEYWEGADLVMEVVSDDDRRRDLQTKRFEYARGQIPEYWIVDPQREEITVLVLSDDRYDVHGTFKKGQQATSHLLPGFKIDVASALAPD